MPESFPSSEEVAENIVSQSELLDDVIAAAASVAISEFLAQDVVDTKDASFNSETVVDSRVRATAIKSEPTEHTATNPMDSNATKKRARIRPNNAKNDYSEEHILAIYMNEAGEHELLTKEDEVELAQTIEVGVAANKKLDIASKQAETLPDEQKMQLQKEVADGEAAHKKFVESNLRLVTSLAKKYPNSVSMLDRIQDGNLGLIHAVDKFDWRKGFKFSTYATWWIRQAIKRGVDDTGRTIRIPRKAIDTMERVLYTEAQLELSLGRKPTVSELVAETELPEKKVKEILNYPVTRSLDGAVGGQYDSSLPLGDFISDTKTSESIPEVVDRTAQEIDIQRSLNILTDTERRVVELHFGLDGKGERTLSEIAEVLGYKGSTTVHNIENRALAKLKHPANLIRLEELL